jgi:Carboxypeptidase regulatory-like domain
MRKTFVGMHVAVLFVAMCLPLHSFAQNIASSDARLATVVGTVTDANNDTVPSATVILKGSEPNDQRTVVTPDNGFFQFQNVKPGIPYLISVSAEGFADWISPRITLEPGQFKIVTGVQLRIEAESTTVEVRYDPVQVATEQLKVEEKQRVLGFIPNFYVSYEKDPAPLTPKMKFHLALKVSTDPVTAVGILGMAGIRQGANSMNYGQGWAAYGKRLGATAADGYSDILIGGAILPSLLHQDPRYFYQGTGTTSSRIRHAMFSPFVTRNDNGTSGPNFSTVGGVLASSALANLYFPHSDRGIGLVFGNFAIGMAERMGATLAQEFIVGKFSRRGGHEK